MSVNHSKRQFSGMNDPGHDFSAHNYFDGFSFEDTIIPGANFTKGASLRKAKFIRTNVIGANLEGAFFNRAEISDSFMDGANLLGARLNEAEFTRTSAIGANFEGAVFNDAEISESHMEGANFTGINLARLQIEDSHMQGANFSGATSHGARIDGTNIMRTNMEGADFTGANLTNVHLANVNLTGANFTSAIFTDVSLRNVNLTDIKGITLGMMKDVTFDNVTINGRIFNGNAQPAIREMYKSDLLWNERAPLAQFVDAVDRKVQDASEFTSSSNDQDMLKLIHNTLRRRNASTSILQYIKPEGNGKKKSKRKKTKKRKTRSL